MAFLYLLPSSWYLQPGFLWGLPAPNAQPSGAVDSANLGTNCERIVGV